MSDFAEKCKRYYDKGFYTKKTLQILLEKGSITEEEYEEIVNGAE